MFDQANAEDLDLVVIKLDIVKAFPKTRRADILQALLKHAPQLVRHFVAVYETASSVSYDGLIFFSVVEGIITGDVLGPIYATLVYSALLEETRNGFTDVWIPGYFDDIYIVAYGQNAWIAYDQLEPTFEDAGLPFHPQKNLALCTQPERHVTSAAHRGISLTGEGLEVLGFPVGSPAFVEHFLAGKIESAERVLAAIRQADLATGILPDDAPLRVQPVISPDQEDPPCLGLSSLGRVG